MAKKVLILIGDAVESLEIYYPYYRCLEEGLEVTIAASEVRKVHTVVHDFVGWETYTEKPGYLIDAHIAFSEVNPEEYDGLIIPGGRSPEHIRMNEPITLIFNYCYAAYKCGEYFCHGSHVLSMVRSHIKGRELATYIECKAVVEAAGATSVHEMLHEHKYLGSGYAWPDL